MLKGKWCEVRLGLKEYSVSPIINTLGLLTIQTVNSIIMVTNVENEFLFNKVRKPMSLYFHPIFPNLSYYGVFCFTLIISLYPIPNPDETIKVNTFNIHKSLFLFIEIIKKHSIGFSVAKTRWFFS